MGRIAGGFLPHDPVMFVEPEAPPPDIRERICRTARTGWRRWRRPALSSSAPTTISTLAPAICHST